MKRVETDNALNNRIPKSVSVGYTTCYSGGAMSGRDTRREGLQWRGGDGASRTFRLPFPSDRDFNSRVKKLVDGTKKVLIDKGPFMRIGVSAIDFVARAKKGEGIDSFFTAAKSPSSSVKQSQSTKRLVDSNNIKKEAFAQPDGIESFFSAKTTATDASTGESAPKSNKKGTNSAASSIQEVTKTGLRGWLSNDVKKESKGSSRPATAMTDEEMARQLQDTYNNEDKKQDKKDNVTSSTSPGNDFERDRALALQLQSSYDREHSVLSHVERFSGKKRRDNTNNKTQKKGSSSKKGKIDYFIKK